VQRTTLRLTLAAVLIALGYGMGSAQRAGPDFELVIDSPSGETRVECRRGCDLAWVERGVNPNATPHSSFSFACRPASEARCQSGMVGGWIRP
jgi:hypothetical protein